MTNKHCNRASWHFLSVSDTFQRNAATWIKTIESLGKPPKLFITPKNTIISNMRLDSSQKPQSPLRVNSYSIHPGKRGENNSTNCPSLYVCMWDVHRKSLLPRESQSTARKHAVNKTSPAKGGAAIIYRTAKVPLFANVVVGEKSLNNCYVLSLHCLSLLNLCFWIRNVRVATRTQSRT